MEFLSLTGSGCDKPAQQFERGMQIGGSYKCGSCRDTMMQDLAHSLQCKWRSLSDLQQLVLAGKFGCTRNLLKPFENLKVDDLNEELMKRGFETRNEIKPELQETNNYTKRCTACSYTVNSKPSTEPRQLNLL